MKRIRLLAAVTALGLAASMLGIASADASTPTPTPTIASEIVHQLRYDMTHHNVITIPLRLAARGSKPRIAHDHGCTPAAGVTTCLTITGSGLVLGNMLASFTNNSRGSFEAIDAIVGPARFELTTYSGPNPLPPAIGNGQGLQVGWLQSTSSAAGEYCTGGFWYHGGVVTLIGREVCIDVHA